MARIVHISDLHFGAPAISEKLRSVKDVICEAQPDVVAVSGDLTQRCSNQEFARASEYLDEIERISPYTIIPGNHDIRWLGAVARNLGTAGLLQKKAHDFKYSRYRKHIFGELCPCMEVVANSTAGPAVVIAGLNTAHGITRGSLTARVRDLGVIGHVTHRDVERVRQAFSGASSDAARVVMIHHNPLRGAVSGRHGLAHTEQALKSFVSVGAELILCGHDHQDAVHTIEELAPGVVISTAGTISERMQHGRSSSFNLVEVSQSRLGITTFSWNEGSGFTPLKEAYFHRHPA